MSTLFSQVQMQANYTHCKSETHKVTNWPYADMKAAGTAGFWLKYLVSPVKPLQKLSSRTAETVRAFRKWRGKTTPQAAFCQTNSQYKSSWSTHDLTLEMSIKESRSQHINLQLLARQYPSHAEKKNKTGTYTGLTGSVPQTIGLYSTNQQPSGAKLRQSMAMLF